jgi:hypothetical protein
MTLTFSSSEEALEAWVAPEEQLLMEPKWDWLILSSHLLKEQPGVREVNYFLSILGTCVNVGCVPKKLFHIAAQLGEKRDDINGAGFKVQPDSEHNWETASEVVTSRIKRINKFYGEALGK